MSVKRSFAIGLLLRKFGWQGNSNNYLWLAFYPKPSTQQPFIFSSFVKKKATAVATKTSHSQHLVTPSFNFCTKFRGVRHSSRQPQKQEQLKIVIVLLYNTSRPSPNIQSITKRSPTPTTTLSYLLKVERMG